MALDINALFDSNYYLSNNPDVAQAFAAGKIKNPFDHYITFGKFENRAPGAFFDPIFYLEYYPDVKSAATTGQTTAIDHFINFGQYEGRDPITEFDTSYYRFKNPQVSEAIINAARNKDILTDFEHFVKFGQYEELDPNINFNTMDYLASNSDVSAAVTSQPKVFSGIQHYLKYGIQEGRFDGRSVMEKGLLLEPAPVYMPDNQGVINDKKTFQLHRFYLDTTSQVTITMNRLKADADIVLGRDFNFNGQLENNEIITWSDLPNTSPEAMSVNLIPGDYYVKVYQSKKSQNTNYRLSFQTRPVLLDNSMIGQPLTAKVNLGILGGTQVLNSNLNSQKPMDSYQFYLDENSGLRLELQGIEGYNNLSLFRDLYDNKEIRTELPPIQRNSLIDVLSANPSFQPSQVMIFNRQEAGNYVVRVANNYNSVNTKYQLKIQSFPSSAIPFRQKI